MDPHPDAIVRGPPRDGVLLRAFRAIRDAIERLLSPYTTSEQLLDALRRVEGIRSAAENAERQQLEAQLRQAQKLETVGQLASGIAHDFNNVLAVILANAELLAAQLPPDEPELKASLDKLHAAARGGAGMVRGLLSFSRRAELNFTTLDLREVVATLTQLVRAILPDDVELRVIVPPAPTPVHADGGALQQILLNLVTNARDALAARGTGGTLTIEVSEAPPEAGYADDIPWTDPEIYYCLAVTDTGVGMDRETRDRIFEPFFTTKPAGEGTGLGMAMVYGLTQQHAGLVHVLSEPGAGTTVRIHLPRSPHAAAAPAAAPDANRDRAGAGEMVLLVEDNAELRVTTRRVLERLGYGVVEAADGEAALALYDARQGRIAIVLSDLLMPRLSGPALYRAVRAKNPTARFLFTSGYSETDITQRSLLDPGVPFLAKPWTIADLARAVRKVLDAPA